MLRRMADLIDAGEATAVVALVVVNGQRLYYRGFVDGYSAADLVLGTMDILDILRGDTRGQELPLTPDLAPPKKE